MSRPHPDDGPPSHAARPVDPPPPSGRPTVAQLQADIDSGAAGDKIGALDPALAPLGTDDEAAGAPPSPERVALARAEERGRSGAPAAAPAQGRSRLALYAFVLFIAAVAAAFLSVLAFR